MTFLRMRKLNDSGVTLVELIVSFSLLAFFLAAATMCISHAVLFYYSETQSMSAYSVADIVMAEVTDELRTMQASKYNGYVKVRDGGVSVAESGGIYKGDGIEFVVSNISDGPVAVILDTAGLLPGTVMIDSEEVKNSDLKNIDKDYLTLRYYYKYPAESLDGYKDLYMDRFVTGCKALTDVTAFSTYDGKSVVWHAEEKLPKAAYQNFKTKLSFSVAPVADLHGKLVVKNIEVTVDIYDDRDEFIYSKTRSVELINEVYYKKANTMYSDGKVIITNPETVDYVVEYVDTEDNVIHPPVSMSGPEGSQVDIDSLKLSIKGYKFYESSGSVTLSTSVDTTIVMKYTRNSYDIDYHYSALYVEANDDLNPDNYYYGQSLGNLKAPHMKAGYVFKGWYSDESFTNKVTAFSEHPDYNEGDMDFYAYVEPEKTHDDGRIDGMDGDDGVESHFRLTFKTPDKYAGTAYNADDIIYSLNGYNQNYYVVEDSLRESIAPHDFTVKDLFISSHVYTPYPENKRHTRLYLFQKAAMPGMNMNASTEGDAIVEAILAYMGYDDLERSDDLSVELPAEAVAVYESLHDWNGNGAADTTWEKLDDPEPTVYLHLKFGRYKDGDGNWVYTHYTIWMNEIQ